MSNEEKGPWLFRVFFGDEIQHSYMGITWDYNKLLVRSTPHPVTVTTRIITFLVGNPYKPSFATVTGWGVDPNY